MKKNFLIKHFIGESCEKVLILEMCQLRSVDRIGSNTAISESNFKILSAVKEIIRT
jgi:hypothetical protein